MQFKLNEKYGRLFDNIFSQGALQVVMYIIPLITLPYQTRVIGVENFGKIAFAVSLIMYFNMFMDYGYGISGTKEIATNRHNKNNLSLIYSSVVTAKFFLMIMCFIIFCGIVFFIPKFRQDWLLYMLTSVQLITGVFWPTWFFIGIERVRYVTAMMIIARLIFLVLLFVVVKKPEDYILIPLLDGLGYLTSCGIGLFYAIRKFNLKIYIPSFKSVFSRFKYSTQFFFTNLASLAYSNTNIFFLGLIGTNTMVGYYSAADKMYKALTGLRYPVDAAFYPYMARTKDKNFFKKFILSISLINFAVCLFIFVFANKLITIFYGAPMLPAYTILKILSISLVFELPCLFFGYHLLGVFGYMEKVNLSVFVGSIFHLIGLCALWYFKLLNIHTLAFMVLLSNLSIFIIRIFYVSKYKIFSKENVA